MVFSSSVFLFLFLPITLGAYYLPPVNRSLRARNVWLLLVSLGFYAWGEPLYVLLMLLSIIVNHAQGLLAERWARTPAGRSVVAAACAFNLGMLFVFKYLGWLGRSLGLLHEGDALASLALPIGISFYTFQALSYVVDVYRGKEKAQRSVLDTGLYVAFFPQLVAGPIVRYGTVSAQLRAREHSWRLFSQGAWRFAVGLSKKLLLANQLAVVADAAFGMAAGERSVLTAWAGALAFMLQIYFDFSGYSDMAIGLGRMFGFTFRENFDYPYTARSVTEYWRRWHISLGEWFRDYLYYPLSLGPAVRLRRKLVGPLGRRGSGVAADVAALLAVWLATGLWHGANATFVVWGLVQFAFIVREKYRGTARAPAPAGRTPAFLRGARGWAATFLVVLAAKVVFRADSLADAAAYYASMLHLAGGGWTDVTGLYWLGQYKWFLLAALVLAFPVAEAAERRIRPAGKPRLLRAFHAGQTAALCLLLALDVCYAVGGGYNPFIYFNF